MADTKYTEGVCHDGAAILRNGERMTIAEILAALNATATPPADAALANELEGYAISMTNHSHGDTRICIAIKKAAAALRARAVPDDVAKDALRHIAAIAHNGGLACIKEWEALIAIRRLSLPWWNSSGTRNDLRDRADAAILSATDAEVKNGSL